MRLSTSLTSSITFGIKTNCLYYFLSNKYKYTVDTLNDVALKNKLDKWVTFTFSSVSVSVYFSLITFTYFNMSVLYKKK